MHVVVFGGGSYANFCFLSEVATRVVFHSMHAFSGGGAGFDSLIACQLLETFQSDHSPGPFFESFHLFYDRMSTFGNFPKPEADPGRKLPGVHFLNHINFLLKKRVSHTML
jgi:hypothetical protein